MSWEERIRELGLSQKKAAKSLEESWEKWRKQQEEEMANNTQRFEPLIKKMARLLNSPLIKEAENKWYIELPLGYIQFHIFTDAIFIAYYLGKDHPTSYSLDPKFIEEIPLKEKKLQIRRISSEDRFIKAMEKLLKSI
jgi:hypothetical protein